MKSILPVGHTRILWAPTRLNVHVGPKTLACAVSQRDSATRYFFTKPSSSVTPNPGRSGTSIQPFTD